MNKIQSLALAWLSAFTLNTSAVADNNSTFNIEEFQNKVATDVAVWICKKYDKKVDYKERKIDELLENRKIYNNEYIKDIDLDMPDPFNYPVALEITVFETDISSRTHKAVDTFLFDIQISNKKQFAHYWIKSIEKFMNLANKYWKEIHKLLRKKLDNHDWCEPIYTEAKELGLIKDNKIEK